MANQSKQIAAHKAQFNGTPCLLDRVPPFFGLMAIVHLIVSGLLGSQQGGSSQTAIPLYRQPYGQQYGCWLLLVGWPIVVIVGNAKCQAFECTGA